MKAHRETGSKAPTFLFLPITSAEFCPSPSPVQNKLTFSKLITVNNSKFPNTVAETVVGVVILKIIYSHSCITYLDDCKLMVMM
jgi:hypothetical protein